MQKSMPEKKAATARGKGTSASKNNAAKPAHMSSAEMANTVNNFIQEARKNSMKGHPRKLVEEITKKEFKRPNNPPKKEIVAPNVQLLHDKTSKERKSSQMLTKMIKGTKDNDRTTSSNNISRPNRGLQQIKAGTVPTSLNESQGNKQNTSRNEKQKPVTLSKKPTLMSQRDGMKSVDVRYAKLMNNLARTKCQEDSSIKEVLGKQETRLGGQKKTLSNQAKTPAEMLDYLSSSSEDDEVYSQSKGARPLSPASRAKLWNEINMSPGPSFPGWKFRPPAQDKRSNQIGREDLLNMLKKVKTDSTQTDEPRRKVFSEYIKKFHPNAFPDESKNIAPLEERDHLKKTYAEQLEAMQKKALASLQSLDSRRKTRTSDIDDPIEGISRKDNYHEALQLKKDARRAIEENTLDEFVGFNINDVTRANDNRLGQGDGLHNRKTVINKCGAESENPSRLRGQHGKLEENSSSLQRMESQINLEGGPLHKLNKITDVLVMKRSNRMNKTPTSHIMKNSSGSEI